VAGVLPGRLALQARQAIDLLSRESVEKVLSRSSSPCGGTSRPVAEASPGEIAEATGVARPTVSQALDVLLRLKKIERIGQGRTTRYKEDVI